MDAIAAIYEALDDEETFAALPSRLAAEVDARSALLQVLSPDWQLLGLTYNYFTPEMHARWTELELYRIDPWKGPAFRPENVNRLVPMDEEIPPERLMATAYFDQATRHWGDDTVHGLAGVLVVEQGFLAVGMHRGLGGGAFDRDDAVWMQQILGHLRRLYDVRSRLAISGVRTKLAEASLDQQADAVFVLDGAGRPLFMNSSAQDLVGRGDTLLLSRVGLRARHEAADRALQRAIASACARQDDQGGALSLPRPVGPDLRVLVSPIAAGHLTRALVVVNDPTATDPRLTKSLRGFYGLSAAEADTAAALARGLSPAAVAELRGVSMPTIRTQIRQALRKTDAGGIPELVALVASAPRLTG